MHGSLGSAEKSDRAVGKPEYETLAMLLGFAVYLPGYLIAIQYGFSEFVWGRFLLVALGYWFCTFIFSRRSRMTSVLESAGFAAKVTFASAPLLLPFTVVWDIVALRKYGCLYISALAGSVCTWYFVMLR